MKYRLEKTRPSVTNVTTVSDEQHLQGCQQHSAHQQPYAEQKPLQQRTLAIVMSTDGRKGNHAGCERNVRETATHFFFLLNW